jgi:3-deoxy-manno-octulosonate cytidylyltransferase (CMP-KDO synthetase)
MASTRLPGKPMLDILGMPMIEHVYHRTRLSVLAAEVVVATCDHEIHDHIVEIGGKAVMTRDVYDRSTDRIKECVETLEGRGETIDIVVNVGGDEPMVLPEMIDASVEPMLDDSKLVTANLVSEIKSDKEFEDRNVVKCVFDLNSYALCFSREPIPCRFKEFEGVRRYKQLSVIPFTRDFLFTYSGLPETPCERAESIDMMRVLEHGFKIKMVETSYETFSVDTDEDLEAVRRLMRDDPTVQKYL